MRVTFWQTLLMAIGMVAFLEGVIYALLAERMGDLGLRLAETPPRVIRMAGILIAVLGLLWMWWMRHQVLNAS